MKKEHFEPVGCKSLRSRSSNSRYFQNALGLANLKEKFWWVCGRLLFFLTVIACLIMIGCEARFGESDDTLYQYIIDSIVAIAVKMAAIHPSILILGWFSIICNFGYLLFPDSKKDK